MPPSNDGAINDRGFIVCHENRKIHRHQEDRDRRRAGAKLDAPDDVLLRVQRVGICGSDVHYYLDGRIGDKVLAYPATLGHECAGTVAETGRAVAGLRPGDRVAVDPAIACGRCDQCLAGRPNTCRNLQFLGSPGECRRATAEYIVVPAGNCFAIPEGMTLDEAVLVEPLSVGLHAVRLAGLAATLRRVRETHSSSKASQRCVSRTPRVAIFGAGPIGLGVLLCAKALGPCAAAGDRPDRPTVGRRPPLRGRLDRRRPGQRHRGSRCTACAGGSGRGLRVLGRSGLPRSGGRGARARRNTGAGGHSLVGPRELPTSMRCAARS